MFTTYFNFTQLALLIASFLLIIAGYSSQQRQFRLSAYILFGLASLLIFSFAAYSDPFIHLWDERFHALVAKNMMDAPLKPMLYKHPVLDIPYDRWDFASVWLHKQPFFLWLMAGSMKLFGISEFSLRIPSIILGTALSLVLMRSGEILFNLRTGVIALLLLITSNFHLNLLSGFQPLDQNDFVFISLVGLSIWSFIELNHTDKKKIRWILLISFFAAAAVLTKWGLGLLVYLIWFIYSLVSKNFKTHLPSFLGSLLLTIIMVAPWQIYCIINYPSVYFREQEYNLLHITSVVEGHFGDFMFHYNFIDKLYGNFTLLILIPALYFFIKRSKSKSIASSLTIAACIVFLFFSIAKTKMEAYTAVSSIIILTALGGFWDYSLRRFERYNIRGVKKISMTLCLLLIILRFDIEDVQEKHTTWKKNSLYNRMVKNKRELLEIQAEKNMVLFNFKNHHYVEAMFYLDRIAYPFIPSEKQCLELLRKGHKVGIVINEGDIVPSNIKNLENVSIIKTDFNLSL